MKRKLLIRQLGLLLILYLAVACTAADTETPSTEIETSTDALVESPMDEVVTPRSESDEAITISFACSKYALSDYEALAKQFNEENPDIKVQVISQEDILNLGEYDSWPDDAWSQLVRGADTLCGSFNSEAIEQGLFQNLTSFLEEDTSFQTEDFYPNTLELLQQDDQFWGVPNTIDFMFVYYDKAVFDEAGVAYPELGWTWEDFLEKALALTQREGDETTQWGFVEEAWFYSLIHSRAEPLFDLSTPLFDTPETMAAVRWYTDLHLEHEVMPFFPSPEFNEETPTGPPGDYLLIQDGKAAMWPESGANLQWRRSQGGRGGVSLAPFPIEREGDQTTPMSSNGTYMMSAGTAYPDESWRWLSFLTYNPPDFLGNSSLPARRSVAEATQFWEELEEELVPIYRFAIENGSPQPTQYQESISLLYKAIEAVLAGEKTVEIALADAQNEGQMAQLDATEAAADTEVEPLVVDTPVPEQAEEGMVITFAPGRLAEPFSELATSFNETQPDITVKVRQSGFGLAEVANESDCFIWNSSDSKKWQEHTLNLDPFLETAPDFPIADLYPQLLDVFRQRNSLWAIPQETSMWVMYYNKDLFDAAGVAYPQAGWTLDDFLTTAQALTQGEGDNKQYGYLSLEGISRDLSIFPALMAATWFNDEADPSQLQFNDPALAEAIQWYLDLEQTHQVTPFLEEENPTGFYRAAWRKRQDLMRQGQAAMWTGFVLRDPFADTPNDLNMGVVPLPLGTAEIIPTAFTQGYFISKETPYPQACWRWISYLTEHNAQLANEFPARRSVVESANFSTEVGPELAEAYRFSIEHSQAQYESFEDWALPGFQWLMQAHGQALEGIPLEAALIQVQEKAEAYTACLEDQDGFADEEIYKNCGLQVDPDLNW